MATTEQYRSANVRMLCVCDLIKLRVQVTQNAYEIPLLYSRPGCFSETVTIAIDFHKFLLIYA